ncbi:MAG: transglutaminase domain-containing protein [Myxococcota bacterium]
MEHYRRRLLFAALLIAGCKDPEPTARAETPAPVPAKLSMPRQAVPAEPSGDRWYDFAFKSQKIGYLHAREEETTRDGGPALHVTRASVMKVGRRDQDIRMESTIQSWCRPDGAPLAFVHTRREGEQVRELRGEVVGKDFVVTTRIGDSVSEQRYPLRPGLMLASTLDVVHYGELSLGKVIEGEAISESEGDVQPYRAEVVEVLEEGDQLRYLVDELQAGIKSRSVVDPSGKIISTELPMMGASFERTTREKALRFGDRVDIFSAALFSLPEPLPPNRSIELLTVRLSTRSGIKPTVIEDARQEVAWKGESANLTLRAVTAPSKSAKIPVADPELRTFLQATPYEDLQDPELKAAAKEAIKGETEVIRAAAKLVDLVYLHITEKSLSRAFTSATEAWQSQVGDCTEHAVLFSALAKIVGIPTRLVTGLVYVGGARNQFGYHEWAEVWTGSGWHPVDPTFNQLSADPTHIKFAVGQSDPTSLREAGVVAASLIGDLELALVTVERKGS